MTDIVVATSRPRLLLDQNLSFRVATTVADLYSAVHVREVGLDTADDDTVWEFARQENRVIVSKDSDFHDRCLLRGAPPKVIWLRIGNCSTAHVVAVLRNHVSDVEQFCANPTEALLVLS